MLKKGIIVFLILQFVIFSVHMPVDGREAEYRLSDEMISVVENLENSYVHYIGQQTGRSHAQQSIVIPASDYVRQQGAVLAEDGQMLLWNNESGEVTWEFETEESGLYAFGLTYQTVEGNQRPIEIGVQIDGQYPFEEAKNFLFNRFYEDYGEIRTDNRGNELHKAQKEIFGKYFSTVMDANNVSEFLFYLESGTHTLTLFSVAEPVGIYSIHLERPANYITYNEYLDKHGDATGGSDRIQSVEGEDAFMKSKPNLIALSDRGSANVSPHDPAIRRLNYVGGKNWNDPGTEISWKIDVPETGMYKIGVNYRQKYTLNTTFYRKLLINGECPFQEASAIAFPYARTWEFMELSSDGNPLSFYLEKGEHILTLSVTLGPVAEICNDLELINYDLAEMYRSIVMITGDTPDANRDYNLFMRIPNMIERLSQYIENLQSISSQFQKTTQSRDSSAVSVINNMINVLEKMRDNRYSAHRYKDRYFSSYASLTAMLRELSVMPLDIDKIYFISHDELFTGVRSSMWDSLMFFIKQFFSSFTGDYASLPNEKNRETITIWVNWAQDQARVLKYLIQNDFSVKYPVDVDIRVTNATLMHAALSGKGPDLSIYMSRSEPMNLAMRGALYDLSQFPDFSEVITRFKDGACLPYEFQGGTYALPDTQTFFMMFIRDDIFNEMNLSIPRTWDEFIQTSSILSRNNMHSGLPYTQITEMTQVNVGVGALSIFPTLLLQNGGTLYNQQRSATNLLSLQSKEAFEYWTDFYNKYSFPMTYDFFNRFRVGLLPMAIQNYNVYAQLTAAAPEIRGYWSMYELPGVRKDDGSIDNRVTGGGTGAVLLNQSENKAEAWEFIKWWTSAETQYQYGTEIENILGEAARVPTSNVEALKRYSWDKDKLDSILKQWENVEELPEVPGGYYVSRVIDQAFWNTVNGNENSIDMLLKWSKIANTEIARKRYQYDIP